jgi:hypothetical protein
MGTHSKTFAMAAPGSWRLSSKLDRVLGTVNPGFQNTGRSQFPEVLRHGQGVGVGNIGSDGLGLAVGAVQPSPERIERFRSSGVSDMETRSGLQGPWSVQHFQNCEPP